jgi:nitrite reductase (NADH) small subunit
MTRWVAIGRVADIPRLGARVVHSAQGRIAVFRTADDALFALADRCPHKGGPLSQGIVHGARVTCPLHNFVIDLASGEAVAPDRGCVAHFPIRIEEGVVSLGLASDEENRQRREHAEPILSP